MIAILIIIGVVLFVMEMVTLSIYRKPISSDELDKYTGLKTSVLRLNMFDDNIICLPSGFGVGRSICKLPFSLIAKYEVQGVGTIPRWSKLHSELEYHFKLLKSEGLDLEFKKNEEYYK